MRSLRMNIWYHDEEGDWSVEIGNRLHSHVSASTLDDLVEYALTAIQVALTEPEDQPLNLDRWFAEKASA